MNQSWWGKLAGAGVGFLFGSWVGAIIGGAIGHQFDSAMSREMHGGGRGKRGSGPSVSAADMQKIQFEFFTTTFSVMGHLAKADGRVSESEIKAARGIMHRMNLNPEQVKSAIRLFNEGKSAAFPLSEVLSRFRKSCRRQPDLLRTFVEIQLQAALADGAIHQDQRLLLGDICREFNISRVEFAQIEALARINSGSARTALRPVDKLSQAYKVLGVASDAADPAVKKAYRRLMNQHHPDKLVSKGLPEEMMQLAREKTQEISAAYDLIKQARGIR